MTEPPRIGYARCAHSRADQRKQHAKLLDLGCDPIFLDVGLIGGTGECPQRLRALDLCRPGGVLVVPDLPRGITSLSDAAALLGVLHDLETYLEADGVRYPPGDTQLIRDLELAATITSGLLRLRTRAGIDAAMQSGRHHGAQSRLTEAQRRRVRERFAAGQASMRALAEDYGVSPSTISRTINNPANT